MKSTSAWLRTALCHIRSYWMCIHRLYTYNVQCVQFILTVHTSLMCIQILLCPVFITVHTTMNCVQYSLRPVYPNGKNSDDLHGIFIGPLCPLCTHIADMRAIFIVTNLS